MIRPILHLSKVGLDKIWRGKFLGWLAVSYTVIIHSEMKSASKFLGVPSKYFVALFFRYEATTKYLRELSRNESATTKTFTKFLAYQ